MEYRSISMPEFKDRLEKGLDISGYEIDHWILRINFEEIPLAYRSQLRFSGCRFKYGLQIVNLNATEEFFTLKFDRCVFETRGLDIFSSDVPTIEIENCTSTYIGISDTKSHRINVKNTECKDGCGVYRIECPQFKVTQENNLPFKSVLLDAPKLGHAIIKGVNEIEEVIIREVQEVWLRGNIGSVVLNKKFERLEILDVWDDSIKKLVNSNIKSLRFDFETFHGDILVRDTHIENLKFEELNAPTAKVQFKEVTIDNTQILDCSIPNMIWNQLEFKNPPELVGTDFSGLKMSNVKWPKNMPLANSFLKEDIQLLYIWRKHFMAKADQFDEANVSSLKYDIETYRQLKAASIANHNQIDALAFYRNEMKLYWKLVRIEGGIPWYDRLLVFVNRWSSDFGQNWFLPLLWMFVFALIFYSSILNWNYFGNTWSGGKEFGQFWVLFNPVHKTPEYINTGAGLFTEFFMRVVIGYFIYHFIKASRKFGRV